MNASPPESLGPAPAPSPPQPLRRAGFLRRVYMTLRTEHTTPAKVAAAAGVGVFVGCSPFWGLHQALSVLLATIFRLNRVLVYAVCNFANPVTAPILIFTQVQIGHHLRTGEWLAVSIRELERLGVAAIFTEFLIGSLVVGTVLGAIVALAVYLAARGSEVPAAYAPRVDEMVLRYLDVSIRDAEGARRSLLLDPVYPWLLEDPGFLASNRILDLGCGRAVAGVLGLGRAGEGLEGRSYTGVDLSPRYVRVAREAMGPAPGHRVIEADLRDFDPAPADLVLALNVLRYLPPSAQDALLRRLGKALPPGARVVVRDVDAGAGWRFRAAAARDLLSLVVPGRARYGLHYRRASDVRNAMAAAGFDVSEPSLPRASRGARFVLVGTRRPAAVPRTPAGG